MIDRTSRRALFGVAVASVAAPLTAVAAISDPNPDADLLRLSEEWRRAKVAEDAAAAASSEADSRFSAMSPEWSACPKVSGFDIVNGLAPSTHSVFTPDLLPDLERLRAERLSRTETQWHRAVIDRCDELIAAIPAYYSALEAAQEASGVNEADALLADATRRSRALEQRLADIPAHTLEGVRLKAQLALSVADLDQTDEARSEPHIVMAILRQLAGAV